MDHAITVWDIVIVSGACLGLVVVGAVCILLFTVMNPFRSGH